MHSPELEPDFDLLQRLLLDMPQCRSVDALLHMIVNRLAEFPQVALARIWLVQPGDICSSCPMRAECPDQTSCLHLKASAGCPRASPEENWSRTDGAFRRFPIGVRKVGRAAARGDTVAVPDIEEDSTWIARPEWARDEGIRGFGAQPVEFHGEVLGVLGVFTRTRMSEGWLTWLRLATDHAATAIVNARAFEEIERLRHQLELENGNLREEIAEAQEIGSYQLIERLDRGGMGEVWVARHRLLARPAAIKLIRWSILGSDPESRDTVLRRFEREAQATAALQSHHTVDVYDFGTTEDGAFYYVMELLTGLDLGALIQRFGPISAPRTVYILRQLCHSLAEAHENGLVHRDIKPANIHLCHHGPDFDFVKVLDFGIVGLRGDLRHKATDITGEGLAGTPAFIAPEQARGEEQTDGRADIYALGCVGYWLLTGAVVFEGTSPIDVIVHHIKSEPVPPSKRTEVKVPRSLEKVILSCLEKDPDDRPQSAQELDELLGQCAKVGAWTSDKAKEWWHLHLPEYATSEPVTELFSQTPQGVVMTTKA